eukprot:GABV01002922.1.p4 GENE.GABV01002922.1~~GABV01002922.1.p4  ORF type:complete len:102 (+),score=36.89 GABV01002922.1:238-543(+)
MDPVRWDIYSQRPQARKRLVSAFQFALDHVSEPEASQEFAELFLGSGSAVEKQKTAFSVDGMEYLLENPRELEGFEFEVEGKNRFSDCAVSSSDEGFGCCF